MSTEDHGTPKGPNYRKPPVEYQFKKGQSGHPQGRPKKRAAAGAADLTGGMFDRIAKMALDEALRPISIREGDKVTTLPAMQAVLRSMYRQAANGDTKAQRQLADTVTRAEGARVAAVNQRFQDILKYRDDAYALIASNLSQGLPPPEIYPHPDDIIFDINTGEATVDGPIDREQAGAQAALDKIVPAKLQRQLEVEAELKNDPENTVLKKEYDELVGIVVTYLEYKGRRHVRHEAAKRGREALKASAADLKKRSARKGAKTDD